MKDIYDKIKEYNSKFRRGIIKRYWEEKGMRQKPYNFKDICKELDNEIKYRKRGK